jgi:cell division protease FtsH
MTKSTASKTRSTLSSQSRSRRTDRADAPADEAEFDLPSEDAIQDNNDDEAPAHEPEERVATAPRQALVAAAIMAAATPDFRRLLRDPAPLALVVSVPSSAWVKAVENFFGNAFGRRWTCFGRDGSERLRDKVSVGNDEVGHALADGRSVVGIAVAPDQILPSTLVAAADARLKVVVPNGKIVRRVIRERFGGTAARIEDTDIAGLDLDDLVAAMRAKSRPRDVVARLAAASKARTGIAPTVRLPDLETAVEYGAAREWGLALARDFHDFRAGLIPWSALDRGAILYSRPGTGKSLLSRCLSRACGVNLVTGSIGELFATSSGNLDGVIKAQREMFARAAAAAPCILFLDEIDALPSRESLDSRGRDWWMPIINDFLLLLDAAVAEQREGVVVIGATNRIEAVDLAILRPGRLERAIEIGPLGPEGILNVLKFLVAQDLPERELGSVAEMLEGYTPAEIMELVRSARRAARHAGHDLTVENLTTAALPATDLAPDALFRVAVHEAGHAVVAHATKVGRVGYVRIGGRAGPGAHTRVEFDDSDLLTRKAVEDRVIALLAGRGAECLFTGGASAGAGGTDESDLGLATRMLAAMHVSHGLGEAGLVYLSASDEALDAVRRDPVLRKAIDVRLRDLQARAVDILRQNRATVLAIAAALVERRFLGGAEIVAIAARFSSATGQPATKLPNTRPTGRP